MGSFSLFSWLYNFFRRRRPMLFLVALLLLATSVLAFSQIEMSEDISAMLPDGKSGIATDFRLLQHSPFAKKVVVTLKAGPTVGTRELIETADRLAGGMSQPFFSRVVSGPPLGKDMAFFDWLLQNMPNMATARDLKRVLTGLTPGQVRTRLKEAYDRLVSPEGWLVKGMVQVDPLAFRTIGFDKLRHVNLIGDMGLQDNHFISKDGRSALLVADTTISMTDALGSESLITHFSDLVRRVVPANVEVFLLSPHLYTTANARTIKRDLFVILGWSSLAILALFLIWLRNWRAFLVFVVPVSVLGVSAVGLSFFYGEVSAITLGFGAVLLGISVDFALHVYVALGRGGRDPGVVIGEVSRPVLFGGLTTLVAFSVLVFSDLPGQRQLAVFSMIGIGASLMVSLILFPHFAGGTRLGKETADILPINAFRFSPRIVLCVWIVVLAICLWQGRNLRFDGELKSLNAAPDKIRVAEQAFEGTWGNFRGKAMIFAEGEDLQSALEKNDRLFEVLSQRIDAGAIVSLAPILPSEKTQRNNHERWRFFWSDQRIDRTRRLLTEGGRALGFSPKAFSPFLNRLSQQAGPLFPDDLRAAGLGDLVDSMIVRDGGKVRILTLVPDTTEVTGLVTEAFEGRPGFRLVSQSRFASNIGRAIAGDFTGFIVKASLLVIFLLGVLFRDPKKVSYALIPVATGLIFMSGVMGWLGIEFNLFNIVATILIIGLGVDYGIFIVCKLTEGYEHGTEEAVFVSGLTTLAGFGALVLARHPALHSIGLTVLLGITAAIPSALLVVPALYGRQHK